MNWPFGDMRPFSYQVVMSDPAWSFDNWSVQGEAKNTKAQYACMSTDDIAALPVGHLASDHCWLWLWATHPMLGDALRVMNAWGFKYVTSGVWVKRGRDTETKKGKLAFGTGYVLRSCSEPFLIGKIGDPPTFSKRIRTVIEAPRRQHSRKPDEAYEICETLFGPANRADIFSRESRLGWDNWGFEKTLFDVDQPASLMRDRPAPAAIIEPMPLFAEM